MHIVFVQPVLPLYSIAFFNTLVAVGGIKVTVFADILTKHQLNQYDPQKCQFNVVNLPEKQRLGVVFRPGLFKAIRSLDYDHLVLNGASRDISQFCMLMVLGLARRNVYVWGMFHRIGAKKFISELYFKWAGKLSKTCFTYSQRGVYAQLSRGVPMSKLVNVGTAIDEEEVLRKNADDSPTTLDNFKIKHKLTDRSIILQVVRLSAIKKPWLLIKAAKQVVETRPDAMFVLIGGGDLEHEMKQMVSDYNLNNHVLFTGPIYDESVLSLWFRSSTVFVVPSCIGLSAHHAMCYGLPIITDNDYSTQASEFSVLSDQLNCMLYKAGSIDSLVASILTLLDDKAKRDFISANAVYTIKNVATMKNKVGNFLSAFASDG